MKHEDILNKIREITAQGIAYATEHAAEIEAANNASVISADEKIKNLILEASKSKKHSWSVYECFKNRVASVAATADQYETAIKQIVNVLGL